jgi:pilus assembly protein CpaE
MFEDSRGPASPNEISLAVGILGPDGQRLKTVASALSEHRGVRVTEFTSYPPKLDDLPAKLARTYDVLMVDVDSDTEYAFGIVEHLCASGRNYVMAYSEQADMKLAVRFMRAGAREFFTLPIDATELATALKTASTHRSTPTPEEKSGGKVFVFLGSKGGCGVTTLAANFALALAQESDRQTLLIDLGLPLGDAAINLGMVNEYSVDAALQHPERLDAKMLETLAAKHSSGLAVLGSSNEFPEGTPTKEAVDKLVAVARQGYDFVVVDAGSRLDLLQSTLFGELSTIFLVTQVGISEMRTANLMMKKYFTTSSDNVQIVLNRYKTSDLLFDEKTINDALTRPAEWKIPDDYAAARRRRETAEPMVLIDSAIAQSIRQMARTAGGLNTEKETRKGFFRFLR